MNCLHQVGIESLISNDLNRLSSHRNCALISCQPACANDRKRSFLLVFRYGPVALTDFALTDPLTDHLVLDRFPTAPLRLPPSSIDADSLWQPQRSPSVFPESPCHAFSISTGNLESTLGIPPPSRMRPIRRQFLYAPLVRRSGPCLDRHSGEACFH